MVSQQPDLVMLATCYKSATLLFGIITIMLLFMSV